MPDNFTFDARPERVKPEEVEFVLYEYDRDKKLSALRDAIRLVWTRLIIMCAYPEDEFGIGFTTENATSGATRQQINGKYYYILNVNNLVQRLLISPEALVQFLFHVAAHECAHFVETSHNERFCSEWSLITELACNRFERERQELVTIVKKARIK